jgi:hypothetical protein
VATDLDLHAELGGAALDHAPGIDPVHSLAVQQAGAAKGRAKKGAFVIVTSAGCTDIFIEKGFELV